MNMRWSILVFGLAYGSALAAQWLLTVAGVPSEWIVPGAILAILPAFAWADRVHGKMRLRRGWPRVVVSVAIFVALTASGAFQWEDPATWPFLTVALAFPIVIAAFLLASERDPD